MADESEKLRPIFGETATKTFAWIAAILAAGKAAQEFSANFAEAKSRWAIEGMVFVLLAVGVIAKKSSTIVDASGVPALTKFRLDSRRSMVAAISLTFLVVDVGYFLYFDRTPIQFSEATAYGSPMLDYRLASGEEKDFPTYKPSDFRFAFAMKSDDALNRLSDSKMIAIQFEIAKKKNVTEAVFDSIDLTVEKTGPVPKIVGQVMTASSVSTIDAVYVLPESKSLPFVVSPSSISLDEKVVTAKKPRLSLRDDFRQTVRLFVAAKKPGLYFVTVQAVVTGEFGKTDKIPIVQKAIPLVFCEESIKDLGGDPWVPHPNVPIVVPSPATSNPAQPSKVPPNTSNVPPTQKQKK